MRLIAEMDGLNSMKFQRCLAPPNATGDPMLCIFSEASDEAFGACAYLRWSLTNGDYGVRFVTAKSIVAPPKKLMTPRLEFQGAVNAAPLYKTILEKKRLQIA